MRAATERSPSGANGGVTADSADLGRSNWVFTAPASSSRLASKSSSVWVTGASASGFVGGTSTGA